MLRGGFSLNPVTFLKNLSPLEYGLLNCNHNVLIHDTLSKLATVGSGNSVGIYSLSSCEKGEHITQSVS